MSLMLSRLAIPPSLLLLILCGCSTCAPGNGSRRFNFQADTFSYPNQLLWEYSYDANGKWTSKKRAPRPDYWLHCFVVARSARQFFFNARFDPNEPKASDAAYRKLINRVVSAGDECPLPDPRRVVIPGYSNLHEFSQAHERELKAKCGGAWQSYFQRGHWRMLFPITRHHQERMAERLVADLKNNRPPVVHVVRFPTLLINHALVLFDSRETDGEIQFQVYDPNDPSQPATLTYHRVTRTFTLPWNHYFPGGRVDVYEIYRNWWY